MTQLSSYLQYLPPTLWSRESDPHQFMGQMLCIFEKILTGIDDGVALTHAGQVDRPFEQIIDELPQLFDPWRTPLAYLPMLAAWLGAEQPAWLEGELPAQREALLRPLASALAAIYQQRGTKAGLLKYLDIYATAYGQPRITVDDGEALFRARSGDDGMARLITIARSHTVTVGQPPVTVTVLLHPVAIATSHSGSIFLADAGDPDATTSIPAAIWRLTETGEVTYSGSPPRPTPLHVGTPLLIPTALLVDGEDIYLTDLGDGPVTDTARASLYRFTTAGGPPEKVALPDKWATRPVDMTLNAIGNLIILDRGAHPSAGDPPSQEGAAADTRLIVLERSPLRAWKVSETHKIAGITEPTALAIDSQGRLVIADAGDQSSTTPARLIRIDPADGWKSSSLLDEIAPGGHPLIFPTSIVFESDTTLLICDSGLRWGIDSEGDSLHRVMADPAAIYRCDLGQPPPAVTLVSRDRRLVMPTKLALDPAGQLLIADRGELRHSSPRRNWRAGNSEFGVVVHFSHQRASSVEQRERLRGELIGEIAAYKPAHCVGWIDA